MNKNIFRPGYEKPLHYPCTIMAKAKPNKSIDKRLYCDIFSIYFKREKEWDMSILKDNIEWWCYATDLERYIKQLRKDLETSEKCCSAWETQALDYKAETIALSGKLEIARKALEELRGDKRLPPQTPWEIIAEKALEQIEHKE